MFMATIICPQNAFPISIHKEDELSREFMESVLSYFQLVKDPLITDYVNRVGQRILSHMPSQPFDYRFFVIKENI